MIGSDHRPVMIFGVSILLHLIFFFGLSQWMWLQPRPKITRTARYVMQLQAAMRPPARSPSTLVGEESTSVEAGAVESRRNALTPSPMTRTQIDPDPTLVKPVSPKPRTSRNLKPPKLRPRHVSVSPQRLTMHKPRSGSKAVGAKPRPKKREAVSRPIRSQSKPSIPSAAQPATGSRTKLGATRSQPAGSASHHPPAPQSDRADEDALKTYLQIIFSQLAKHKRYPKYAKRRAMSGRVVLRFIVLSDGRVQNPQVAESDGHQSFRKSALYALKRAGQMPPFPANLPRRQLLVEVPISYKIERR